MSEKKHWYNNPWVVGIGLIILSPIGSIISDIVKQIPFLTTIKSWWIWIESFVNLEIKLWWVLSWILGISIIKAFQIEIKNRKYSKFIENSIKIKGRLPYLNYINDKLIHWTWEWEWEKDLITNRFNIVNLVPLCPSCDTIMPKKEFDLDYSCPKCTYTSIYKIDSDYEKANVIKLLILDNVKKGKMII